MKSLTKLNWLILFACQKRDIDLSVITPYDPGLCISRDFFQQLIKAVHTNLYWLSYQHIIVGFFI